jgi:hypothetical protein
MEVLVKSDVEEREQEQEEKSQILITFRGPASTEIDIKMVNIGVAQMVLAAHWLSFKADVFQREAEAKRLSRLATVSGPGSEGQILVPHMKGTIRS